MGMPEATGKGILENEARKDPTTTTTTGRPVRCESCHRLLGVFVIAEGQIKCKCGHYQRILVERPPRKEAGPRFVRARL
jgi:hypothetical protein